MSYNYTRQSTFEDGDYVGADLFNDEYTQLVNAFAYDTTEGLSGHRHDGSAGQGGSIYKIGDIDFKNYIVCDIATNRLSFFAEVGGVAEEQIRISGASVVPVADDYVSLGAVGAEFKDLFIDGTATIDILEINEDANVSGTLTFNSLTDGAISVTAILDEDDLVSDSATAIPTQQSVKAYVDSGTAFQLAGSLSVDLSQAHATFGTLTGLVNSSNTVYTTADPYIAGTLEMVYNGTDEIDFAETTPASGILTMGFAPETGTWLKARYVKA